MTSDERSSDSSGFLQIQELSHSFGDNAVLRGVSFEAERGEIVALLGPSGSGKTTLLRSIAGFETPQAGQILVEGRDVAALPPAKRGFGMVFQSYALFPHLDVGRNVSFGLETQGTREGVSERVAEMLGLVELQGFESRRVGEISGGQQQRVALARALAPRPSLLMLDEPLSNLDPSLRERTRAELRAALKSVGMTTLLVTHEQEEAFDLGDRVAVLHEGRLDQIASPRDLYSSPETPFVARFIGRSSVLRGVLGADSTVTVDLEDQQARWACHVAEGLVSGDDVEVFARPESLELTAPEPSADDVLVGSVGHVQYLGPTQMVRVDAGGASLEVQLEGAATPPDGAIGVRLRPQGLAPRAFGVS